MRLARTTRSIYSSSNVADGVNSSLSLLLLFPMPIKKLTVLFKILFLFPLVGLDAETKEEKEELLSDRSLVRCSSLSPSVPLGDAAMDTVASFRETTCSGDKWSISPRNCNPWILLLMESAFSGLECLGSILDDDPDPCTEAGSGNAGDDDDGVPDFVIFGFIGVLVGGDCFLAAPSLEDLIGF